MSSQITKRILISTAALGMALSLAACGSSKATSDNSSSSTTSQTTSAAAKAVKQANHLISQGKYQAALDTLNEVDHQTTTTKALRRDLRNYLAAKESLKQNNLDEATTSLSTVKSSSATMKSAYGKLRSQIASAKESTGTGAPLPSNQPVANAAAASATSEDVISSFANQAGFNKEGYGIMPISKNGDVYRFEVRQDNADKTIANFIGIYDYNQATKQITQIQ